MSYEVQKSVAHSVPVKLVDDSDFHTQETGKTGGDVTVRYKKCGASSWSTKDVSSSGWDEIGNGYYEIDFTTVECDTVGRFDYQVECSGCLDYNGAVLVVEHNPLSDIQNIKKTTYHMRATVHTLDTTTSADFTINEGNADIYNVGDVMRWTFSDSNTKPLITSVTEIVNGPQATITWTPALTGGGAVPTVGDTVIISSNVTKHTLHSLAIPASPVSGSPNERIKAIDDKLPTGDISDFDEYRGCANVGYDGSTLTVNAWLEHRGEVVTNPSSCIVTIYDDAGTQQFELSDDSADAQGVFKMTKSSPGLTAGKSYYAKIQIAASGSTYVTIEGVATL